MSEGRYRPLLCLTQVAVEDPSGEDGLRTILIDGLQKVDVSPLAALLADPDIEVVLHAGRQDIAILRRVWGTEPVNIFDTQIVAGFAGESAQAGYANLISSVLGNRLGKTASYTRWDVRPLTTEQLSYAAEDVIHLFALADELRHRLRRSNRLEWALEECRRLESVTDERDPDSAWERLPRIGSLDGRSRAVARALAAWRERTAGSRGPARELGDPGSTARRARQASSDDAGGRRLHPRNPPVDRQATRRGDHRGDRDWPRPGPDPEGGHAVRASIPMTRR